MPAVSFDDMAETAGAMSVDFSKFVDPTPLAVHPRLPLETVMELFKKLGPRVILIEHRGRLMGLVTVKDCLKYQFQAEAHELKDDTGLKERQERLWDVMKLVGTWVTDGVWRYSGGRLRLSDNNSPPPSAGADGRVEHQVHDEQELELEDRRDVV